MAVDNERVAWQDRYLVQQLPTVIDVAGGGDLINGTKVTPVFDTTPSVTTPEISNIGLFGGVDNLAGGIVADTGRFLMKLTDHPHLPAVSGIVDTPLTMGTSARNDLEFQQTISEPGTITLNMQAQVYNLSLFLYSLFQSGYQEEKMADATTN